MDLVLFYGLPVLALFACFWARPGIKLKNLILWRKCLCPSILSRCAVPPEEAKATFDAMTPGEEPFLATIACIATGLLLLLFLAYAHCCELQQVPPRANDFAAASVGRNNVAFPVSWMEIPLLLLCALTTDTPEVAFYKGDENAYAAIQRDHVWHGDQFSFPYPNRSISLKLSRLCFFRAFQWSGLLHVASQKEKRDRPDETPTGFSSRRPVDANQLRREALTPAIAILAVLALAIIVLGICACSWCICCVGVVALFRCYSLVLALLRQEWELPFSPSPIYVLSEQMALEQVRRPKQAQLSRNSLAIPQHDF